MDSMNDAEQRMLESLENNKCLRYSAYTSLTFTAAAIIGATTALGIYAFGEHDPTKCWVANGVD